MKIILTCIGAVLRELGMAVRNWGETEWSIAFVVLLGIGYLFLKSGGTKKSL